MFSTYLFIILECVLDDSTLKCVHGGACVLGDELSQECPKCNFANAIISRHHLTKQERGHSSQ